MLRERWAPVTATATQLWAEAASQPESERGRSVALVQKMKWAESVAARGVSRMSYKKTEIDTE